MSQAPSIYTRQRDFTDGATNNPEQQVSDIATGLDAEFVAVANSLNTTINRLSELQKDDGALRDAIVSAQNLDTSLRALITLQGTTIKGAWATGTSYAIGDVVSNGGGTYLCVTAHQASSVFETDSTAGKWLTLEAPYNNSVTTTQYTANGSQVSFSLGVNGIVNVTSVFIDGVYQNKNTYDISGSTLTFGVAPPSGSIIEMIVGAITPVTVSIPDLFISNSMLQNGSVTPANLTTGGPSWDTSGNLTASGQVQGTRLVAYGAGEKTSNLAVGAGSLVNNTTGTNNSAVGVNALAQNTTGGSNLGIGNNANVSNQTGVNNVAVGVNALLYNLASNNTALGVNACTQNTTGVGNVSVGLNTGYYNTVGNYNTALGSGALVNNSLGGGNVAIGINAGQNVTGDNNLVIGSFLNGTAGVSNTILIGTGGIERMKIDSAGAISTTGQFVSSSPLAFRNRLINAGFAVNQRAYASGTATSGANQYTVDRWQVVTNGQSITFTTSGIDTVITAPAGGFQQIIEGNMIEGGTYVLSWTGTATATVNGTAVTNGGTITLTANTNATVKFSSGTVQFPQLEMGSIATPFERRPYGFELSLCQRYYWQSASITSGAVLFDAYGAAIGARLLPNSASVARLPVDMRSTITVSVPAGAYANVTSGAFSVVNGSGLIAASGTATAIGRMTYTTSATGFITASSEL
jgi:hypothetical protein